MQYGMRYFQNISIKRTDSSIAGDSMNKEKNMRNRIKKIISTVLCAGLVAGLAGGCSGTGDINGENESFVLLCPSQRHIRSIQEWKSLKKL